MRRREVAIRESRRPSDSMVRARSIMMRGDIVGSSLRNSFPTAGASRGALSGLWLFAVRPRTAVGHGRSCAGTSSQLKIAKYRHVAAQAAFPLLAEADGNRTR